MEQPSFDKTTVEHQYDTLIKKVLIGEAKNARAELKKRRAYEVNLQLVHFHLRQQHKAILYCYVVEAL